jgi:hypothetical protein
VRLAIKAAQLLDTVLHQKLVNLMGLPLEIRMDLCVRLKVDKLDNAAEISAQFIIATLVELAENNRECMDFYLRVRPVLDQLPAVQLYTTAYQHFSTMSRWLRAAFEGMLRDAGFVSGVVQEDSYIPRGGYSPRLQFVVRYGGKKYIHGRDSHRYFPRIGDKVLFEPSRARSLTPSVFVTVFTPVK